MSVKVTVSKDLIIIKKQFPKLMIYNGQDYGFIVLFTSSKTGVVLTEGKDHKIGELVKDWAMDCFQDYEGEVTLKNE